MEIITGRKVIDIEIEALNLLKNYISKDFVKVVNLLLKNKGKIIVSGIGKSGHIASKIASTLSSVGSPSFYIHPSEANCIKSLRSLYPNLLFTNKPVDNLFQKCFVTISYSSSVIEDSLNSRVPVILFDQWKRYMHCKSNLTERNAIYYINTYDSLCESVDKILRVKDFDFNEFVFEGYSKDNINKKIFTLINK